jgi:hypothetical protein
MEIWRASGCSRKGKIEIQEMSDLPPREGSMSARLVLLATLFFLIAFAASAHAHRGTGAIEGKTLLALRSY